ncbi:MAG TPA: nitroreductase [Duganella sp.]|uniref:nitroreductase n=1 Tax=Duganella sp. TaxID=1904440 RepID=UPI002ED61212
MISTPEQQAVDAAITSRRSIRAYLPQAVAREDISEILRVAGRAPSGTNTQPWKVYVLEGERKRELSSAILAIHNDPEQAKLHTEEYAYYPREWVSPFIERRRKVGWDLYALLGLTRDNKAGMAAQHGRNYEFFGAPVGLIFTIDRVMEQGSWLDYGMFLQSVMVAARARGLDTCPQAAFTQYHRVIGSALGLPDNEAVVCGMALGYADTTKIENSLITERMPVEEFVKFVA